jgi:methylmalonyl-CoA mutase
MAKQAEASVREVQAAALAGENVFAALMEAAKVCSLGTMTMALHAVGGQYRRNM